MAELTSTTEFGIVADEIFNGRTDIGRAARRIAAISETRRDFVVNQSSAKFDFVGAPGATAGSFELRLNDEAFRISPIAHRQIASALGIPQAYYDRMKAEANPELLANNVQHWFRSQDNKRMIRTLEGNARAFLSNRYRPLDNDELLEAVLPALSTSDFTIDELALTEARLYMKVLAPRLMADILPGDTVQAGVIISNSEVGMGALKIEPFMYRLVCSNGMIHAVAMNKFHVGRANSADDKLFEIMRDETKTLTDAALWNTVRDVTAYAMSAEVFNSAVEKLQNAAKVKVVGNPAEVIEMAGREIVKSGFVNGEKNSILEHLSAGGDLSAWGYANAVTRMAQDVTSYDRRVELERLGAQIVEIPARDWERIGKASLALNN